MGTYYKLHKINELADNDQGFVRDIVLVFLTEIPEDIKIIQKAISKNDYNTVYQVAHKIKPTIELFDIGVLSHVVNIQDWGKYKQKDVDIQAELKTVVSMLDKVVSELKADFKL